MSELQKGMTVPTMAFRWRIHCQISANILEKSLRAYLQIPRTRLTFCYSRLTLLLTDNIIVRIIVHAQRNHEIIYLRSLDQISQFTTFTGTFAL